MSYIVCFRRPGGDQLRLVEDFLSETKRDQIKLFQGSGESRAIAVLRGKGDVQVEKKIVSVYSEACGD